MFSKKNCILDMSKIEMISHQIVLIDDTFSKIKLGENSFVNLDDIKNPFESIANNLVLKTILKEKVVEIKSDKVSKDFACGDFSIRYEAYPSRLRIKHTTQKNVSDIIKITKDIISFADIQNKIYAMGTNYEMFIENERDDIIKNTLLKKEIAKEFTNVAITPVLKIDDITTLNLKIAGCEHNGKKGIYFRPNFHSEIKDTKDIETILNKNLIDIAKEKIQLIFG